MIHLTFTEKTEHLIYLVDATNGSLRPHIVHLFIEITKGDTLETMELNKVYSKVQRIIYLKEVAVSCDWFQYLIVTIRGLRALT